MKPLINMILTTLFVIGINGCASHNALNKDDYDQRSRTIKIDMSKNDFIAVFPEATPRGAKKYSNGIMEVLEVGFGVYSFVPSGNRKRNGLSGIEEEPQWFYFYDDKLVQYGNPNDWPAEPTSIVEVRRR